jgi:hypothetical protein
MRNTSKFHRPTGKVATLVCLDTPASRAEEYKLDGIAVTVPPRRDQPAQLIRLPRSAFHLIVRYSARIPEHARFHVRMGSFWAIRAVIE